MDGVLCWQKRGSLLLTVWWPYEDTFITTRGGFPWEGTEGVATLLFNFFNIFMH